MSGRIVASLGQLADAHQRHHHVGQKEVDGRCMLFTQEQRVAATLSLKDVVPIVAQDRAREDPNPPASVASSHRSKGRGRGRGRLTCLRRTMTCWRRVGSPRRARCGVLKRFPLPPPNPNPSPNLGRVPRAASAEEPYGGNLLVRIRRGPGAGNCLGLLDSAVLSLSDVGWKRR